MNPPTLVGAGLGHQRALKAATRIRVHVTACVGFDRSPDLFEAALIALRESMPQSAVSMPCRRGDIDVTAPEQIVEASDAVPTVAIRLDHEPMLPCFVSMAVILR